MTNKTAMTKLEIKQRIFDELAEHGAHVTDASPSDGYFIYEFGDNSVYHFRIKGCARWKFGLWIVDTESGKYRISLFGHWDDWIDKFKPTATAIATDLVWSPDEDGAIETLNRFVWVFYYDYLGNIQKSPRIARYFYGYHLPQVNLLVAHIKDTFFYRVQLPVMQWYERKCMTYILKVIAPIYRFKLGWSDVDIAVKENKSYMFPTHDFRIVCLKDVDSNEETYRPIYDKYVKGMGMRLLNLFDRNNYVSVFMCYNHDDHRGFYFTNNK